jgi:basic membrane lipoprotein Med (substrate-binding protein (PBP1-ABC) superfamily)
MEGRFKSENILGGLSDEYLTIAPFGPAVPADAVRMVGTVKQEFVAGKRQPFPGPLRDNKGVERVKAGEAFPVTELRKMDWLVEGVVGQPR